ncbi:type VI secretion system contractile sheath domain-containing protein [Desulfovibrio gilichinskyi]|uniref:Type VI secretion system protein ImpC n=1 Tax=Desulfovibrio gilichinskyi TaxID=1519643 RepID=A0A1X7D614_9BACT|nr:type VI secretion system contractile sheath large subunit [Desulfovibrio gilichinskyi]SMF09577.1 type VI secretion system protein ImpC [Desulfovibrio gilichinskyi]
MHIEPPVFSILAIGQFSPALEAETPPVLQVDSFSLDDAVAQLSPTLDIPADKTICPSGVITVSIHKMADFKPKNLPQISTFAKELEDAKDYLKKGGSPENMDSLFPMAAGLITIPAKSAPLKHEQKSSAIDDILSMVDTSSAQTGSQPSPQGIEEQINSILSKIQQTVFTDKSFRIMESAWRGAQLLAGQVTSGCKTSVKLTLVPFSKNNFIPVFDQLESKLAETPPDIILIDKEISSSPRAMTELERVMDFAETMLAPAVISMSPSFFGIQSWDKLKKVRYIPALLESAEYGRWKTLVERSGAGWVMACIGSIMARPMYKPESGFSKTNFTEENPLWISAPWTIGALCSRSVAEYGQPTRFCDRGSIRLEQLPLTDGPSPSPLEIMLNTERLSDFKQAGIIALAGTAGRDHAFVAGAVTIDGGPLKFKMFLSQLTGFLIRLSVNQREEIQNIVPDLTKAISLFIQSIGFPAPQDLQITTHNGNDGATSLEITFTPDREILSTNTPITFGFNW